MFFSKCICMYAYILGWIFSQEVIQLLNISVDLWQFAWGRGLYYLADGI